MKISISPSWAFTSDNGERVDPQLFHLLASLNESGKLTVAASQLKISYRHAWNLINKWSTFFGAPIVDQQRGVGTRLTILGSKLLWAQQRSEAAFTPQLESLALELNLEISRALRESRPVLRVQASHGYAIAQLPVLLRQHNDIHLDLKYTGSIDALKLLVRDDCELAGFHIPQGEIGHTISSTYKRIIDRHDFTIIRMVTRTQGMMVGSGNPKNIQTLRDLERKDVRFINRQSGSGTRLLLEQLLEVEKIEQGDIHGFDNQEFTHAAIAAYVGSSMADAGFGVESAARLFQLDFIPMVSEHYMLACRTEMLSDKRIKSLIDLLKGQNFRSVVGELPGYHLDEAGQVISLEELLERI